MSDQIARYLEHTDEPMPPEPPTPDEMVEMLLDVVVWQNSFNGKWYAQRLHQAFDTRQKAVGALLNYLKKERE